MRKLLLLSAFPVLLLALAVLAGDARPPRAESGYAVEVRIEPQGKGAFLGTATVPDGTGKGSPLPR